MYFEPRINALKKNFSNIFIYTQEDLKKRFPEFISSLQHFLNISPKHAIADFNNLVHMNVSVKTNLQVNTLKRLNYIDSYLKKIPVLPSLNNIVTRRLRITPRLFCQNRLRNINSKKWEINSVVKTHLMENYQKDWKKVMSEVSF